MEGTVTLKRPASAEELAKRKEGSTRTARVPDILRAPVPWRLSLRPYRSPRRGQAERTGAPPAGRSAEKSSSLIFILTKSEVYCMIFVIEEFALALRLGRARKGRRVFDELAQPQPAREFSK